MNMRPPALDLPIMFIDVRVTAGAMAILDGVTLTISPGPPTVLIAIVIVVNALAWMLRRAGERLAR